MCGWFTPHIQGLGGQQNAASSLSLWVRAGRHALEKRTEKTKTSRNFSTAYLFFGSSTCFQHVHQSNQQFKDLLFRITNCCTFSTYEGLGPTWRPVTEVTARSLRPLSMWLLHPTNLCHYIIVFKWFAHKWCETNFKIMWLVFPKKWNCYPVENMLCETISDWHWYLLCITASLIYHN